MITRVSFLSVWRNLGPRKWETREKGEASWGRGCLWREVTRSLAPWGCLPTLRLPLSYQDTVVQGTIKVIQDRRVNFVSIVQLFSEVFCSKFSVFQFWLRLTLNSTKHLQGRKEWILNHPLSAFEKPGSDRLNNIDKNLKTPRWTFKVCAYSFF